MWTPKKTFASYAQEYRVRDAEMIQLGKGDLGLKTMQIFGRDSFVLQSYSGPSSVWHILGEAGWLAVWMPLTWSGAYSFNGCELEPGDIVLADTDSLITTTSANRHGAVIGIKRTVLDATCRELSESQAFVLPQGHRTVTCSGQRKYVLHHLVKQVFEACDAFEQLDGKFYMPRTQEVDLIASVAEWIVDSMEEDASGPLKAKNDYSIFSGAIDAIMQTDCTAVSMADLCKAAGVGKTRLHQCFDEMYGVSPMHFLMKLRLTKVREQLLDSEVPFRSVKEAALTHGFSSLGRFSGYYSATFGEYPSQTLQRSANGG